MRPNYFPAPPDNSAFRPTRYFYGQGRKSSFEAGKPQVKEKLHDFPKSPEEKGPSPVNLRVQLLRLLLRMLNSYLSTVAKSITVLWIKKMDRTDWLLIGLYYGIAFVITFFAEWSEEDIPLFSVQSLPLLKFMLVQYSFQIAAVIMIVFWVFNRYFHRGQYLVSFLLMLSILLVQTLLQYVLLPDHYGPLGPDYTENLLWGIMDNFSELTAISLFLIARQYYSSQNRLLALERNQKDHELRLLEAQVDPHFLFNNLNILSILIESAPEKASRFTTRLSALYRYLIRHRNEELVPLQDELVFSQDYVYLLEQRFDNLFKFDFAISADQARAYSIPPAAMQTLLENVVKHNTALPDAPIRVSMSLQNDTLIVKNDYRPKQDQTDSLGTGLDSLNRRIGLLTGKQLISEVIDQQFVVVVPLVSLT